MGWYVHISVIFACDENKGVADLAKKHLENLGEECHEAHWFLNNLSKRTGTNDGPKGGLSLWGTVGNHTNAEKFVEALRPFWTELLSSKTDGGPFDFEHILVFYEPEQSESANAYEISFNKELIIKHHPNLPFCWGQM